MTKSHLMNEKNMAQSYHINATVLDKWGVAPVERRGRGAFYGVTNVINSRVSNAVSQVIDDEGETSDDELLRIRIRLLTIQAKAQGFKDERERGNVIDTAFRIYVFSRLASQISSVMDSPPLAITRKSPGMKPSTPDGLKKEVIRICNTCVELDENISLVLSDYLMETTGNVLDKLQPNKDK